MAAPISQLLQEQSTNVTHYTGLTTGTDKKWAKAFHPITKLLVHTSVGEDGQTVFANWGALQSPLADDDLRMSQVGYRPNARRWRLDAEEDCGAWFHTEVSNITLAAWNGSQLYALSHQRLKKVPLVIGEWERNILDFWTWQSGRPGDKGN
ncbi:hypothetical protein MMYC01_205567 [Madurella mycetomatis]|uniref:Uncharacterized protein n=1 Tax=Madurella mycetomatis TaxID=100816 RepID=A0A175W1N4_9PEZI|nr:hypothetical protein MMYC01_205567 [Madurella mycetomatis]